MYVYFYAFFNKNSQNKTFKNSAFHHFWGQRDAIPYISNELSGKPLGEPKISIFTYKCMLKRQLPSFIIHQKIHKNLHCLAVLCLTRTVNFQIIPTQNMRKHANFKQGNGPSADHCRRGTLVSFLIFHHFQSKMSRLIVWRGVGYFAPGVLSASHQREKDAWSVSFIEKCIILMDL